MPIGSYQIFGDCMDGQTNKCDIMYSILSKWQCHKISDNKCNFVNVSLYVEYKLCFID